MIRNVAIYHFSGTGNTAACAEAYRDAFDAAGISAVSAPMERFTIAKIPPTVEEVDLIGIGFVVHCFDAPSIVFDFIRLLPAGEGRKVFLFKSMADALGYGGTTAHLRRLLRKKGYEVIHEGWFLMPSNWVTTCGDIVASSLLSEARNRAQRYGAEMTSGKTRFNPVTLFGRALHLLGPLERLRSRLCSIFFRANSKCIGCGDCVAFCPVRNITMKHGRPSFHWRCLCCMRCIYACPAKAIRVPPFNIVILRKGYDAPKVAESLDPATLPKRYRAYFAENESE